MQNLSTHEDSSTELKEALLTAGWTENEILALHKKGRLQRIRNILLNHRKIHFMEHEIDLDSDPWLGEGIRKKKLFLHTPQGKVRWTPELIKIVKTSARQYEDVWKVIREKNPANARLMEYLRSHQHLIPKEWRDYGTIYFWGSIFEGPGSPKHVRCMHYDGYEWSVASDVLTHFTLGSPVYSAILCE